MLKTSSPFLTTKTTICQASAVLGHLSIAHLVLQGESEDFAALQ
jgi:hypothetical protein